MLTRLSRLAGIAALLALLISLPCSASAAPAKPGMQVIKSAPASVSQPLRSIAPLKVDPTAASAVRSMQDRRLVIPKTQKTGGGRDASIVQDSPIGMSMPSPDANFEGVNNINSVYPPDTQGDIGIDPATNKKYYIQWVNLSFRIWDVSTPATPVSVYGPAAGNTLWSGYGGICESNNDGDPITMFDHLSNRWVMTQFAISFPNNFHECIAVSTTADPTGSWYRYDFQISTTKMNDYPHLGVWQDGYYMSINQFNGNTEAWNGAGAVVFERTAMLSGAAASMIYFDIGAVTLNYGGMLPSDLDGPAPAAGTPNYFMEWDDSTWLGDPSDTLRVWEFHVDWATPANSTFGLNSSYAPNLTIATTNVDPDMCGGARNCIPQPGTTVKVDAIADRLMHRLQFRDFGTYQTIVGNHTVDATSADKAGVHWFELRDTGSGFAMNQQGVYAPDTDNRWMGSIAMDESGNMALGYSVSSSAIYPSIRYTGRLAADPAGTLPQGEASMIAGGGSQTGSVGRWGDYSAMSVDPEDGCTFWYTQEYYAATSNVGWQTRIGSFKFPSCTSAPTGTLSGTVTDTSAAPIEGVTVEATGGYSTVTDAAGHYELTVVAGTYTVTASKYGYVTGSASSVVVTPPGTTTQDFALTPKAQVTVNGTVTDGSGAGWPLYATIAIEATGFSTTVFTNPVTGLYSVNLFETTDYTFNVSAPGYETDTAPVTTGSTSPQMQNFSLSVGTSCDAPGYTGGGISENFDSGVTPPALPIEWAVTDVSGTAGNWATNSGTHYPSGQPAHSSPNLIYFNSFSTSGGEQTRLYRTSGVDLSSVASMSVSFWMYHDTGYSSYNDRVQVQVSTNGGSIWNNVGAAVSRYNGTTQWTQHTVDLTAYTGLGNTDVRVAFLGISAYGNDIHIDDVLLDQPCTPASGGLVAGAVYDANTGLPLAGVRVTDHAASSGNTNTAGMFVLYSSAGTKDVTAIAPKGYDNVTASVSVTGGDVTGQDFHLPAGVLGANPTSLTFDVTTAATTASKPLALNNSGGKAASYDIFAIPGAFAGYAPTGPFADNTRHFGPKNLNDKEASQIRVDVTPRSVTPLAAGDVSASWNTGLTYAWGIGFNTDATDLWIGNSGIGGGDDLDYRFTTAGVNTGDTINTATWMTSFAADMAYNPFTKTLWQVNVGGNNCIYELDPVTKTSTGNKICPAFGTSERGLAFDPLTSTYYAGSWNDGIINHFAPDGTILDSDNTSLSISGLAFNPATGHLFVMTNANTTSDPTLYDVYVLDTKAAYAILGGFNLMDGAVKAFADYEQAGLEMDCSGKLWATNQGTQKVYVADSGETGVCDWQATWLSASPATGSAPAGGNAPLTVNVNAAALTVGTHTAYLRVANDTPYGQAIVPVTLNVTASTTTTVPPCVDNDSDGYFVGQGCTPLDCNDNDPFYTDVCPNCEVKVIPRALGWFLGEKEKTRCLLVIGKRGTEFDKNTPVKWESGDIAVVSQHVFFKRFMFMKVSIDGAALGKGDYRALIGTCSATLSLVK